MSRVLALKEGGPEITARAEIIAHFARQTRMLEGASIYYVIKILRTFYPYSPYSHSKLIYTKVLGVGVGSGF